MYRFHLDKGGIDLKWVCHLQEHGIATRIQPIPGADLPTKVILASAQCTTEMWIVTVNCSPAWIQRASSSNGESRPFVGCKYERRKEKLKHSRSFVPGGLKSFPHIHWLFIFSFNKPLFFSECRLNLLVANFINNFLTLGEWQLLNLNRLSGNWCALGWSKIGFEFAAVSCPNWVLPVSSALKQIKCDVGSQCRHVCAL